jgi:hypothetical protein
MTCKGGLSRTQGFSLCFGMSWSFASVQPFLMKDVFMSTANSSSTSASNTAAKTTVAAKPAEGGTSTTRPAPTSSAAQDVASQGTQRGLHQGGSGGTANESPKSHPTRQVDMPIQGERQCYFGEVVNERGTYWAQLLVRVVDKVSVMVDTHERIVVATHLLGGNAKLFLSRQVTNTEVLRSASGEDQVLLYTKGGSGYPDKLVFQYNRV